jgi:uncharacterized membrane protein YgaE (UPF0421/DUF939 family)
MAKKNVVDKITDEDTKITITNRSVKWIIGILVTGILSILGLAWGLYIKVDSKVDTKHADIESKMEINQKAIIEKIDGLEKEEIKPNSDKNYKQDLDIVRLYERTNSRHVVNDNTSRPEIIDNDSSGPSGPPTMIP